MSDEDKTLKQIKRKIYFLENKEKIYAQNKKWRENNKDKMREIYRKKHYKDMKNPEFVEKKRERGRRYYQNHKEENSIRCMEYYLNNKEKIKLRANNYYQEHKEEILKKKKEYYMKKKLAKEIKSE